MSKKALAVIKQGMCEGQFQVDIPSGGPGRIGHKDIERIRIKGLEPRYVVNLNIFDSIGIPQNSSCHESTEIREKSLPVPLQVDL